MAGQLSAFGELEGIEGVFIADSNDLRCSALKLKDDRLCLFSPVTGLGEKALESLAGIGEVAFLLAPNHYHNKALRAYADAFPDAELCASDKAAPRLRKVTGLDIASLKNLRALLPPGVDFIEPVGLKTGEVWLRMRKHKETSWLVVDAFCGPKIQARRKEAAKPEILKPFPTYGTGDKAAYAAWVCQQIREDEPKRIIPCHGAVLRAQDLPAKLESLVQEVFVGS
ncbi:hypothetical protein [Denitrobaculum tricleocarpae]|uniref:DUF4336 domain-containing protein n=1 Tax=Denitrobaculum tricleocarpae TaxID=2591009 RepID=A0A545TKT4_9PROT|nr:hypothetical protein [Denitrobaculum tricleocarpae]TQV77808.1 hypothetical protein FKG95_19820 [Denitrobaculum tricleocarpae]